MLDDVSLLRLAEMGVDVYAPRSAPRAATAEQVPPDSSAAPRAEAALAPERAWARVVLLARVEDPRAKGLLAQVARALAFARVDSAIESTVDEARIGDAAGLVVFGDALVRQAGAVLSGDRRENLQWIATGDSAEIATSGSAKRALWSELRRVIHALRIGR
jgi:hypothetical protein